jgi:hypothetical protein
VSAKKVEIQNKDLPPLSSNGEYVLRYRIVSEDKNRNSAWSPVYRVDAKLSIRDVSGQLGMTEESLAVALTWETGNRTSSYDVFVSFGIENEDTGVITWENYFYHGSTTLHSYNFLRPPGKTNVRVKIQLAGMEKQLNSILTICTLEGSESSGNFAPNPPTGATLTNTGSQTSLNASWTAPAILGRFTPDIYIVSLYNASGGLISASYATVPYPNTSLQIQGLSASTTYSIKVSLKNLANFTSELSTSSSNVSTSAIPAPPPPPPTPPPAPPPPCLNTYSFIYYDGGCNYQVRSCTNQDRGVTRVTTCSSPGTDSTGATIPGCYQVCPPPPPPAGTCTNCGGTTVKSVGSSTCPSGLAYYTTCNNTVTGVVCSETFSRCL